MTNPNLMNLFSGWDGYHKSLVNAISPLTHDQLTYRLSPESKSVGEIAAHIAFGRLDWFNRMGAEGATELAIEAEPFILTYGAVKPQITENVEEIVGWLEKSWAMIEANLTRWTVENLFETYEFSYLEDTYAISRQWTIWRVMAHDIQHGGQLTVLLGAQGVELPELGDNGGHIIEPAKVGAAR